MPEYSVVDGAIYEQQPPRKVRKSEIRDQIDQLRAQAAVLQEQLSEVLAAKDALKALLDSAAVVALSE